MLINTFKQIEILSLAAAVPTQWISVESLKNGDNDAVLDRFVKNTGVKGHFEAMSRQAASDFCFVAARKLLEGVDKNDVGILVFVTQSADYKNPSTACILQDRLGLPIDCMAFDVNLGCSGFTYGIGIASSLLETSNTEYALLLTGDTCASGTKQEGNSKLLFGDGGTALLIRKSQEGECVWIASRTNGAGFKSIWRPFGCSRHRDVPDNKSVHNEIDVFNFAINEAPLLIKDYMQQIGTTVENYDNIALHQANNMIVKQVAKRAGFSKEKNLISIDLFGNTSCASIPLSIVNEYGEVDSGRKRFLTCGFGVGLSWALADFVMDTKAVLPLIKTDDYFDDGLF